MSTQHPAANDNDYWREKLSPEQYYVLRESGTERPGTGELLNETSPGVYACGACNTELFTSETKFDAGCGWPSFTDPLKRENILYIEDRSHGMVRTEVRCKACNSHLGHVFPDGPGESGERYCINSLALGFAANRE